MSGHHVLRKALAHVFAQRGRRPLGSRDDIGNQLDVVTRAASDHDGIGSGQHTNRFHNPRVLANAVPLGFWFGGFSSTAGYVPARGTSNSYAIFLIPRVRG
jgi:hypothetical protein